MFVPGQPECANNARTTRKKSYNDHSHLDPRLLMTGVRPTTAKFVFKINAAGPYLIGTYVERVWDRVSSIYQRLKPRHLIKLLYFEAECWWRSYLFEKDPCNSGMFCYCQTSCLSHGYQRCILCGWPWNPQDALRRKNRWSEHNPAPSRRLKCQIMTASSTYEKPINQTLLRLRRTGWTSNENIWPLVWVTLRSVGTFGQSSSTARLCSFVIWNWGP